MNCRGLCFFATPIFALSSDESTYALSSDESLSPSLPALQIPFADYGFNPPNSSDDYGRGAGDQGDGGGEEGARGEEEGGPGAGGRESEDEAESRMLFTAFTAVCSVGVSRCALFFLRVTCVAVDRGGGESAWVSWTARGCVCVLFASFMNRIFSRIVADALPARFCIFGNKCAASLPIPVAGHRVRRCVAPLHPKSPSHANRDRDSHGPAGTAATRDAARTGTREGCIIQLAIGRRGSERNGIAYAVKDAGGAEG